jgi:hypothetical protein
MRGGDMPFTVILKNNMNEFVEEVNNFLRTRTLVQANFQRNIYYPRPEGEWTNETEETFTAFLVTE